MQVQILPRSAPNFLTMNYTYQEWSESGSFANPHDGKDIKHATSMRQLRHAMERWADLHDDYADARDATIRVWRGHLEDVTDVYPDFDLKIGPRGGIVRENL